MVSWFNGEAFVASFLYFSLTSMLLLALLGAHLNLRTVVGVDGEVLDVAVEGVLVSGTLGLPILPDLVVLSVRVLG